MQARCTGIIRTWKPDGHYGFIRWSDRPDEDVFINMRACKKHHPDMSNLKVGDLVEFSVSESARNPGKLEASHVKLINGEPERKRGEVKIWDAKGGWGFIDDGSGEDIFVHISSIGDLKNLIVGQIVSFVVAPSPKRAGAVHAVDVELV
jgi:cold shock CspA family protein